MSLPKKKVDYVMFKIKGSIVKVDPDIYSRIFNKYIEFPKKYNKGIIGIVCHAGRCPAIVFGKKPSRHVFLSRFVMNAKDGQIVDHKNRDPLDNRRCNLRFATYRQNGLNKICKNTSGYIGVSINRKKDGYFCLANFKLANGKGRVFRLPDSPENRIIAAFARDKFVLQAGEEEYAPLNFPCFKYEPFRSFLLNENLRFLTKRQIGLNIIRENSSGYIGVTVKREKNGYFCLAKYQLANGKAVSFRLPDSPENRIIAAFARDKFVLQAGEENYAPLNFPCFKNEPFRTFLLNENLRKYKKRVQKQTKDANYSM
ncbi:MAG: HNH endonuclease [Phycisphaerae bacterium]|jgi:hypothetical protein